MFKYGSFFGLSAVHLMFLRQKDVDRIFKFINIKPSTISLVRNLYTEARLLREIFSATSTEPGIPHVVIKKDLEDPKVSDLIAGLNNLIAAKAKMTLPETSDIDLPDLESLADLTSIDPLGLDEGEKGTSFFSDSPAQDALAESSSDDLFADLGDMDFVEPSMEEILMPVAESTYTYRDLAAWGKDIKPDTVTVSTLAAVTRYMRTHKNDFSEEEYRAITTQIAELPSIPVGIQLPATFKQASAPASEETLRILSILYKQMYRKVDEIPFIDMVINKLESVLCASKDSGRLIFFAPTADFSRDKTIAGSNYFIGNLREQYLSSDNMNVLTSNINVLLSNCEEVMGLIKSNAEQQALASLTAKLYNWESAPSVYPVDAQQECINELLDYADIHNFSTREREAVTEVVSQMVSKGIIRKLLKNPDNLKFLITLYCSLYTVVTQEFFSALGLYRYLPNQDDVYTLDQMNEYCIDTLINFTKETGICGLYIRFEESYFSTLQNIEAPLAEKTHEAFEPDSVNFRMARLLRMHLLSMQKRLIRKGVK